jgi:hypothetical protein
MSIARRPHASARRGVPAALAAALLVTACGGKGSGPSGPSYSISVDPGSLSFAAEQGASVPAAKNLTVGFVGEGLVAGWPAGASPPSWLDLQLVSYTSSSQVIRVSVSTTSLAPATYTATIRLVTGNADGSAFVVRDVPVTFAVTPPPFTVTGPRSVNVTEASAAADLDLALTVKTNLSAVDGAACPWQVTSSVPWLSVAPASGTLASDTPVVAHLDPEALWTMANTGYLPYSALLTFTLGQGCGHAGGAPVAISVNLDLRPAFTAASVAFTITDAWTAADARKTVLLGTNVGTAFAAHARWTATLDDDWVTLAPTTGTGGATLTLDLASTAIGSVTAGHHETTLTVTPADPKIEVLSLLLTLDLEIPTVAHVSPYTTWVNRASPIVIRGGGFGTGPTRAIQVGATTLDATVVSSTELHATIPAQGSPGRLAVRIATATPRGGAQLVVLPEPAYAATSIALPDQCTQLTLDPERQAVLLARPSAEEVTRLRWDGAAWATDRAQIGLARGSAVSVDGDALLVIAGGTGTELHRVVTLDPETLASRSTAAFFDYYADYTFIAPFDDGRTLLAETDQWSGFRWYPGFADAPNAHVYGPNLLLSRDRRRLLARPWGNANYSDAIMSFDSTDTVFQTRFRPSAVFYWNWDVSGDGGRMLDGLDVYDRSFTKLGSITLAAPAPTTSAISPDGAYVYTLQKVSNAWVLRRTGVNAAAGPYAPDDTPLPFVLASYQTPTVLRVSEDGSTLFLLAYYTPLYGGNPGYWFYAVPLP